MTNEETFQHASSYAVHGLHVFPCHGIVSGTCTCGNKSCTSPGKHPRTKHGVHDATIDMNVIREWEKKWPDANIAVACGRKSGIWVLDIDRHKDKDGFLWFEAMETLHGFPQTPRASTPTGGAHLIFRYPDSGGPIAKTSDGPDRGVDIMGDGGYIIVEPSFHINGGQYIWDDSPLEWDGSYPDAPEWLLEIIRAKRMQTKQRRICMPMTSSTRKEIESALGCLDADPRDEWIDVGMCIHSQYVNMAGRILWDNWSQTSGKYDAVVQEKTWRAFRSDGGLTMDTLFARAYAAGWSGLEAETGDTVPAIAAQVTEEPIAMPNIPPHLLDIPGLVGEITQWILDASVRPLPILALGGAITACGTIYGRRYATQSNLRTNFYSLAIAKSGHGKDAPIGAINVLFKKAGCSHFLRGGNIGSGPGLIAALMQSPVLMILIAEAGFLLQKVTSKNSASYEHEIASELMDLYSCASRTYHGKLLSGKETPSIEQPHICLYGASTPEKFYGALSSLQINDGFIPRMMIFHAKGKRATRVPIPQENPPTQLVESVQRAVAGNGGQGDMVGLSSPSVSVPICKVPQAPEVEEIAIEMDKLCTEAIDNGTWPALWGRVEARAAQLALVRALGRNEAQPRITADDARWGAELAVWLVETLIHDIQDSVADNATEGVTKRLLSLIRQAGPDGITKNVLTRRSQWLHSRERQDILSTLIESDQIRAEKNGKRVTYFVLNR